MYMYPARRAPNAKGGGALGTDALYLTGVEF